MSIKMALVVTGGAKNGAFHVTLRSHEERELVGFVLRWSKRRQQKAAREGGEWVVKILVGNDALYFLHAI